MNKQVLFSALVFVALSISYQSQAQLKKANKEQLDSIISLKYEMGSPGFYEKTEFNYTHTEQLRIEMVSLRTYDNSGWRRVLRKEYSYNAQDQLSELLWMNWDSAGSLWTNGLKAIYSNNLQNQLVQVDFLLWNKNTKTWDNLSQETYNYNSNGDKTSYQRDLWTNSVLIPEEKTDYFYHADNRFNYSIRSTYDGNSWINATKVEFGYASNNELSVILYSNWVGSNFLEVGHGAYVPDANGNAVERSNYSYQDGNNFDYIYRSTYTYNLSVSSDDIVGLADDPFFPYYNKLTAIQGEKQDKGVGNYEKIFDYLFYYSGYNPSSIHQAAQSDLKVFPNPVSNTINICTEEGLAESYMIYDLQGRMVQQGKFGLSGNQIDISNLASGTYAIRVKSAECIYQSKFVKN